jgi:signal transduction histidine kinase
MGEAVRETIDRSEALIAALLLLARSEGVHGREEPVDIAELTGDCITDLHHSAEVAGISIRTALEPAVARGDSALFERLLANLLENGIRHNHPDGELSVATSTVDGMVEVLVCNGGAVIDPSEVQSLTQPFRRLSRTAGGFGLGLSIVRSVAEVHGGTVELQAPPGGGLEVRVRVPASAVDAGGGRPQRSLTKS